MRDTTPVDPESYSVEHLNTPSPSHSIFNNFMSSAQAPERFENTFDFALGKKPLSQSLFNYKDMVDRENLIPGMSFPQYVANNIADMAGGLMNPLAWITGGVGGALFKGGITATAAIAERALPTAATALMRRPLAEMLGESLSKFIPASATAVSTGEMAAANFGALKGFAVPDAIMDNFNYDTKHLDKWGVIKQVGGSNGLDLELALIPMGLGMLGARISRSLERPPEMAKDVKIAAEAFKQGAINEREFNFIKDAHAWQPEDLEEGKRLKTEGEKILKDGGVKVDTAEHKAQVSMLSGKAVAGIQAGIADGTLSNLPDEYKSALSQYVTNNHLDNMRLQPNLIDGIRGVTEHIDERLSHKDEMLNKSNVIVDKYLEKGLTKNEPLSQDNVYKALRKSKNKDEVQGLSVPDNVKERISKELQIHELKGKNDKLSKKHLKTGDNRFIEKIENNNKKIEELEKSMPSLMTPKEELNHIREKLANIKDKSRLTVSKHYQRLIDLAHVWNNAKILLDHVNITHQYERQAALNHILKSVVQLADNDIDRLARPENVADYLRKRIESGSSTTAHEQLARVKESIKSKDELTKLPADHDTLLNEAEARVNEKGSKESKKEFREAREKFKEFKGAAKILNNLISCVVGSA